MAPTVTLQHQFQFSIAFNFLNNNWINNTLLNFMYIKGYKPCLWSSLRSPKN